MKRLSNCIAIFMATFFILSDVYANRAASGELVYEHISDSTYKFFFMYFNSCAGDTADTVQTLCLYNSCLDTAFSTIMHRIPVSRPSGGPDGGTHNIPACPRMKTNCDTPATAIPGYKEYWFTGTVTLPSRCSLWKFSVTLNARPSNNKNLAPISNNNMYVEATLNNIIAQGNSSPYMVITSTFYICAGMLTSINNGAIDPDGDSLATEVIRTMMKGTNCTDTTIPVPFATDTPAYSIPSNPFQTNNTLYTIPQYGQIYFTPADTGISLMSVKVTEYRNGIPIGSITRDIQIITFPCTNDSPKVILDTASITGGFHKDSLIYGCNLQPISFCWDIKAMQSNTIFIAQDNHKIIPGLQSANVTYQNQGSDSIRGCLTWVPNYIYDKDVTTFDFIITIRDSTCKPPNWMRYFTRSIPIKIFAPVHTINDTTICLGKSVELTTKGGADYSWSVLSGITNSLSCVNCSSPVANPSSSTTYKVVSAMSAYCGDNEDTVTVNILPSITSSIKIIASDTNIKEGTKVYVTSLGVNCPNPDYEWQINGLPIPGEYGKTLVYKEFKDLDTLTCRLVCNDTCAAPPDTISNSIVFHVKPKPATFINDLNITTDFKLYPNPNNGKFILTGDETEGSVIITIMDIIGQSIYSATLAGRDTFNEQIDVSGFSDGLYILTINTNAGRQILRFEIKH